MLISPAVLRDGSLSCGLVRGAAGAFVGCQRLCGTSGRACGNAADSGLITSLIGGGSSGLWLLGMTYDSIASLVLLAMYILSLR